MKGGENFLGDLLEAFRVLEPQSDEERQQIADSLGFDFGLVAAFRKGEEKAKGGYDILAEKRKFLANFRKERVIEEIEEPDEIPLLSPVESVDVAVKSKERERDYDFDVFVNYSRDARDFAQGLLSGLEKEGITFSVSDKVGMFAEGSAPYWLVIIGSDGKAFQRLIAARGQKKPTILVLAPGFKNDSVLENLGDMSVYDFRGKWYIDSLAGELKRGIPNRQDDIPALFRPDIRLSADTPFKMRVRPLFQPNWQRQIVVELLSSRQISSRVDLKKLVRKICSLRPVTELPLLAKRTLMGPVEVLLDVGSALSAYTADLMMIRKEIEALLRDQAKLRRFRECPTLGCGTGLPHQWKPYQAPPPGTPVIVVSHFSAMSNDPDYEVREWSRFFDEMKRCECPVTCLSPVPEDSLPAELKGRAAFVEWDRGTTLSRVKVAVRKIE